jgi:uncharacterized membrane protein YkoI
MSHRAIAASLLLLMALPSFGGGDGADRKLRVDRVRERAEARIARRQNELGLSAPAQQLEELSATVTALSIVFRYQQLHEGIPVHGAHLVISVSERGERENNGLVLPLSVDTSPGIERERAKVIALNRARAADASQPELIIVPAGSLGKDVPAGDRLAWKVEIDGAAARTMYIDAHSGDVLSEVSASHRLTYYACSPSIAPSAR